MIDEKNIYIDSCYFCGGKQLEPKDLTDMIQPLLHGHDADLTQIEYMKQNNIGGTDPETFWYELDYDFENPLVDEIYAGATKLFYKLLEPVAELVCKNHYKYIQNNYPDGGFSDIYIHQLPEKHDRFNYTRVEVCPICFGSGLIDWISNARRPIPKLLRDHEKTIYKNRIVL